MRYKVASPMKSSPHADCLNLLLLFMSLVMISGCSDWVGEPPLLKASLDISESQSSSAGASCQLPLAELSEKFSLGTLTARDIDLTLDCADHILNEASDAVVTQVQGALTHKEIRTVFSTRILGDPETLEIWLKRFLSIREILLGVPEDHVIYFSELKEIERRAKKLSIKFEQLSTSMYRQITLKASLSQSLLEYAQQKKRTFSIIMNMMSRLFQSEDDSVAHGLPKNLLLKQYSLWEGLEDQIGHHYIEAAYLANRMLFGKREDLMDSDSILPMLSHIEKIYHSVTDINALTDLPIWTPKESLQFLDEYEHFLIYVFDIFLKSRESVILKTDLIHLLELLHADVHGQAQEFVDAIFEFKTKLFGGDPNSLSVEDVRWFQTIFSEALENYALCVKFFSWDRSRIMKSDLIDWAKTHGEQVSISQRHKIEEMIAHFEKVKYFWTVPFQRTDSIPFHNFALTQVARTLVYYVVKAYDADHDSKLSLSTQDHPSEISGEELFGLLHTVQKILKGLDLLTEGESVYHEEKKRLWAEPLRLTTMGKWLATLADQVFFNGNGDQALDEYEILEMTSFTLENSRAVTWFVWDPLIRPFHVASPNDSDIHLAREGLLDVLPHVPALEWYFPQAFKLMTPERIKEYVTTFSQWSLDPNVKVLTSDHLDTLFASVRFIEILFLRYDEDQNGDLDNSEIDQMYQNFKPIIKTMTDESLASDHDRFLFPKVAKQYLKDNYDMPYLCFRYAVSHGRFPKLTFRLFFQPKEVHSNRFLIAQLLKQGPF